MTSVAGKAANFILVLFSCLITIAVFEVFLRIHMSASDQAVHMMSSPSMVQSGEGIVKYSKNTSIRSAAIDRSGMVYDVRFDTNNLGFVDLVDYTNVRKSPNIVLLGDSFTAGYHGGVPWIADLRRILGSAAAVFNLGVSGTGIREFEQRLNYFAKSVPVDEIYILAISNDFYRRPWYPASNGGDLWFCSYDESRDKCMSAKPPIFYSIGLQSSTNEVLAKAKEIRDRRPRQNYGFAVYRLLKNLIWKLQDSDMSKRLADPEVQKSLQSLSRIVNEFGKDRVFFVHLPEKHEVVSGRYDLDFSEFAGNQRINYIQLQDACPLTQSMFFEREPHPNAAGYKRIAQCIASLFSSRSMTFQH